jgi:hypothetical protein
MTATAVDLNTMSDLNNLKELTWTAATANTDGLAEVFTFSPTRKRFLFLVDLTAGASAEAGVTVAFSAGTLWAGQAISGSATKDKIYAIEVDTARVKGASGVVTVTLTPGTGDKLLSDHACKVMAIDLI